MKIPSRFGFKVLDQILYERYMAVRKNPDLKNTNRWDLSDTFYNTRKRLDAMGYDVSELKEKRGDYHAHVKDWCDKRVWKIFDDNGNHIGSIPLKRHLIGIFAADRAVMAFQGELSSVSFENYKDLAHLGVDIVLVEKEGTVEKLVPFTRELGIAFVQSQGFIAEYGVMLAEEARKQSVNLAILTDFDASGINLAYNINRVIRIGADLKMLEEFNEQKDENGTPFEQLDPLELMESYNGADHWKWCETLSKGAIRNKSNNKLYYATTQHDKDYIKFLNTEYEFSTTTKILELAKRQIN